MFLNYFKLPYLQFYVFTHCGELKVGISVGQMNLNSDRLMVLADLGIKDFILKVID